MSNTVYPAVFTILMFTAFTVNSAFLEVVVAYSNVAFRTGHIIFFLNTQIACMLPTSSTLVFTNNILEVALGAKIGAAKLMTRYDVGERGGHTAGTRLKRTFTMITIQLVNNASLGFFTTCALATSTTRDGKQGRIWQGRNLLRGWLGGNKLLGQGSNMRGGRIDKNGGGGQTLLVFHSGARNIIWRRTTILLVGVKPQFVCILCRATQANAILRWVSTVALQYLRGADMTIGLLMSVPSGALTARLRSRASAAVDTDPLDLMKASSSTQLLLE
jgi:hypothetical protein